MIGAIKRYEIYKRMGISKKDVKRVTTDVNEVIKLLSQAYNTDIPEEKFPEVIIVPGESSSYDRTRNVMNIAKESIGNGESYAAEVGHFLRDFSTESIYKPAPKNIDELKAHEFLDRTAYIVMKDKSRGTILETLFEKKSRDYSSKEGRNFLAALGQRARKLFIEAKEVNSPDKDFIMGGAENEKLHFKTHVASSFADQYSATELLDEKDIYSLPANEIKRKFFHKRKKLENLVNAAFLFVLPFFIVYLVVSAKLNGSVIGHNNIVGNIIFPIFFILLILTLY